MSLIALYCVCRVRIYYNVYRFKQHDAIHDNKIIEILFQLYLIKIEAYTKPNNIYYNAIIM